MEEILIGLISNIIEWITNRKSKKKNLKKINEDG